MTGNSEDKLKMQFAVESRNYRSRCLLTPTPVHWEIFHTIIILVTSRNHQLYEFDGKHGK